MKGAVWIIGSLFWDPDQGQNIGARKKWRSQRLKMKKAVLVKAPIRYGRISSDGSYTMVFSKDAEEKGKTGTAFVVPFKKDIASFKGVSNQAEFLSKAEGANDKKLIKGKKEKWCIIGILFNPKFLADKKKNLLASFRSKLVTDGFEGQHELLRLGDETPAMKETGEINLKWPTAKNKNDQVKLSDLDFILATCTVPRTDGDAYPGSQAIFENLKNDKRNYFFNNVKYGITTYQDKEVLAKCKAKKI